MKRIPEFLVATAAFVTALSGTLVTLPLVLDNPVLAATGSTGDKGERPFPLPSERVEARLAYIKGTLKITDAQTAQWNAFADVMRHHAKDADAAVTAMWDAQDENLSAIDRIERHQQIMANEAAQWEELLETARPLYASLSEDQKKSADELLADRFGRRSWFHHAHGPDRMMGRGGMGTEGPGPRP